MTIVDEVDKQVMRRILANEQEILRRQRLWSESVMQQYQIPFQR